MSLPLLLLVLSAVTYRVARFVILDSLIDESRNTALAWLEMRPNLFARKLHELVTSAWCFTVWVAGVVVAVQDLFLDGIPYPVWSWLAVATGSLVWWAIIDHE